MGSNMNTIQIIYRDFWKSSESLPKKFTYIDDDVGTPAGWYEVEDH